MKIKVILYSETEKYISRILKYYESHNKELQHFDLRLFSDQAKLAKYLEKDTPDILLVDENCEFDLEEEEFLWAYLSNENSVDKIRGIKAIGKYQRIENLFRDILQYYAENNTDKEFLFESKDSNVYLFQNASGGAGCTTVAMAYAWYLAECGKKVLYLNLEIPGAMDEVLEEKASVDFGDVLYAVKSSEKNLAMKLRALTMQSQNGIHYFNSCKHLLDLLEMTGEDLKILLSSLKESDAYDVIVIDKESGLREIDWVAMNEATDIVFILNDSHVSRKKFLNKLVAVEFLDQQEKKYNMSKIKVLFNCCDNHSVQALEGNWNIEISGRIPTYYEKGVGTREIVNRISRLQCMRNL